MLVHRMNNKPSSSAEAPNTPRSANATQMLDGDRNKQLDPVLSDEQKAQVRLALARRNGQAAALGNLHRIQCLRFTFYLGPDYYVNFIVTSITMFIVLSNMAIAWTDATTNDYRFAWAVVLLFLFASMAVMCSDPGVYPRLKPGEEDPLGQDTTFAHCKVCNMRRPPRTSHCYVCNVCVREHDHHCGILGGCVGVRNLRWFTLYLIAVAAVSLFGVYCQIRLVIHVLAGTETLYRAARATARPATRIADSAAASAVQSSGAATWEGNDTDLTWRYFAAIFFVLIDLCATFLVGLLAFVYVIFILSSMTRRIWQRRHAPWYQINLVPAEVWRNVRHALFPPSSMLTERVDYSDEGATVSLL